LISFLVIFVEIRQEQERMMSSEEYEVPSLAWRKASKSAGNGECVEVASAPNSVAIRDSKNPGGAMLMSPRPVWRAFLSDAKNGVYDLPC
jgi:hypothetical protein